MGGGSGLLGLTHMPRNGSGSSTGMSSNSSAKFRYPQLDDHRHTFSSLATDARLCGGLSFLACIRVTMQALLMMLAIFLAAFVLNLHLQLDSMQNELNDGKRYRLHNCHLLSPFVTFCHLFFWDAHECGH